MSTGLKATPPYWNGPLRGRAGQEEVSCGTAAQRDIPHNMSSTVCGGPAVGSPAELPGASAGISGICAAAANRRRRRCCRVPLGTMLLLSLPLLLVR
jgi:hypothetical protein